MPASNLAATYAMHVAASNDLAIPRVLFVSSNGTGMGHLTRLLAYARRCAPDFSPYFFSLSQAVPVVASFGYPYEYLASREASGISSRRWHDYLAESLSDTLGRLSPEVAVFDGTWPYEGLRAAQRAHPQVRWVWSRRGMWRRGRSREQLTKSSWFDLVLEPGDFAAEADHGVTAAAPATRVGPVTLLDSDELLTREEARRALGLPIEGLCGLVTLGAGTINDTSADMTAAIAALRDLSVEVCVTDPVIASADVDHEHVHVVREYPLSRYFNAFDVAISAAGYNSFHELLRFGVPTLFVPNRSTAIDDQVARASFAADHGLARVISSTTDDAAPGLVAELLKSPEKFRTSVADHDVGNGAEDAAAHLTSYATATRPRA